MGKINGCLKCLFIFFNVLFAIIGCVLIITVVKVGVLSHQLSMAGSLDIGWLWVFAIGVFGISCLGIYAGSSEKDLAIKIFAGFMGVGMIIMMIFGIIAVVTRNKMIDADGNITSEVVKPLMENEEMRVQLIMLQTNAKCCGFAGAQDWGNDIPYSCQCNSGGGSGRSGCKSKPQGTTGPDQIYKQACGYRIFEWVNFMFQIVMGFCFGFAVTALLGLLISLLMLRQLKRHDYEGGASIAMKGF